MSRWYWKGLSISELVGKTLTAVNNHDQQEIEFVVSDDEKYMMYHPQDCCEHVYVEDINGDLADLVGTPILVAEARSNSDDPPKDRNEESYTWTFYELRTIKGSVTIRWYGSSNGYYSESVDFQRVMEDDEDQEDENF